MVKGADRGAESGRGGVEMNITHEKIMELWKKLGDRECDKHPGTDTEALRLQIGEVFRKVLGDDWRKDGEAK